MTHRHIGPLIPFLLFAWAGCSAPGSLSNGEARAVIEHYWNSADVSLVLGNVTFVTANADTSKGRVSETEWPFYAAYAKRSVLTLQNIRDLTGEFTGLDDFFALTQLGVRKTATVVVTEQGRRAGEIKRVGEFEELWIKATSTAVESIVANDEYVVGTDKYRVVVGTHSYSVPDDLSEAFEAVRGWDRTKEGRFKVLLKFDPIDKDWNLEAADTGKRSADFRTNYVGQMLQALKLGDR